ncbi:MAG: LamG domain-containing protein [Candidatus Parvarchaeota archaeon]|nr:LamG domain-containing protein [Candidatus Parvarchaeota archaeon]
MSKSQAAIENLVVYGIAIAIITAAVVALYLLGVFSPSNYISPNTVSGFTGLAVSQTCIPGGALVVTIENIKSYPIEILWINTTGLINSNMSKNASFSSVLQTGQSQIFFVLNSCPKASSARYSSSVRINYLTGNSINPGPFLSKGTISGESTSSFTPEKVAYFDGPTSYEPCGSATSTCTYINSTVPLSGRNLSYTMVAWINTPGYVSGNSWDDAFFSFSSYAAFSFSSTDLNVHACYNDPHSNSLNVVANPNTWQFVAVAVRNSSGLLYSFYLDGNSVDTWANNTRDLISNYVMIGGQFQQCDSNPFVGEISDAQIYKGYLSPSQINSLYTEGLGGAPLQNAGLVAWWPLDGNANDYSGNANNGRAINVTWVSP